MTDIDAPLGDTRAVDPVGAVERPGASDRAIAMLRDWRAWREWRTWKERPREGAVLVAVVLAAVLGTGAFMNRNHELGRIPTAKAKSGPVTIKVTESGELRAQDQVTVSAVTDKQILWLVPEGSYVQEGDTLLVFESQKYVISAGEAQSSVQVERANLDKAESELEAQRSSEEAARKRYESLPELAKKGYIQESEVEEARLAYLQSKSKTRSLAAAVNAAQANVQRASRAMAQEVRKLNQGVLRAPRAGLVVYATSGSEEDPKKISVGMTPFEGMDLMYLPDVSSMLVDVQISEVDLSKVNVGQPAVITLDAYPGSSFKGEVTAIGNLAKRKISRATGKATGARVFDVTVKVLASDQRLKPGLTANADIIAHDYQDAVYVPMEAVFFDEKDAPMVYVKRRGRIESRAVTLGESNDRVTIVNQKLAAGEEVLLGRPASF
jgi:HlyD family secretion protein